MVYERNGQTSRELWMLHGIIHRDGGPAEVTYQAGGNVEEEGWYVNGQRHRLNGPAQTRFDASGSAAFRAYFEHGNPRPGLAIAKQGAEGWTAVGYGLSDGTWQASSASDAVGRARRDFLARPLSRLGVHPDNASALDALSACIKESGPDEDFAWTFSAPDSNEVAMVLHLFPNP